MPRNRVHLLCDRRYGGADVWRRVYWQRDGRFYAPAGWVCEGCGRFVTDELLDRFEPVDSVVRKREMQRRRRGTGLHRPTPRQT